MKVVHVITALGYGGAERLLVNTLNGFPAEWELHVVYLKGQAELAPAFREGVKVHHIPMKEAARGGLRQFLLALQPDVLHTHLGHADWLGLWASRGMNLKRFCTMHNIWYKKRWLWDWLIFGVYRLLFGVVVPNTQVIAISQSVDAHCEQVLAVPRSQLWLVYNAIPSVQQERSQPQAQQQLGWPMGTKNSWHILFVGRLELQKSALTLVQAVALLPTTLPWKLWLVGEGSQRPLLEKEISRLGLSERITLVGTQADVEPWFQAVDVLVLPSVFEGLGLVILEAFQARLPVVASRLEGPQELIEEGQNGLLAQAGSPEDFAEKLLSLYHNPELAHRLSQAGYRSYTSTFRIETYIARLVALYQQAPRTHTR